MTTVLPMRLLLLTTAARLDRPSVPAVAPVTRPEPERSLVARPEADVELDRDTDRQLAICASA
jgi:hypothetical protein